MHDAFAVIRWSAAGIDAATASLLWSESVAAEVLVFFVIGPTIVTWLTPAGALAIAAAAGVFRWAVMARTTEVIAIAIVQPLHGVTFALLHLACMRLLARIVPPGLEGTAQAIYGTLGVGATTALLTLVSGLLYARLGAQGFWIMAVLCAAALPMTWKLRDAARRPDVRSVRKIRKRVPENPSRPMAVNLLPDVSRLSGFTKLTRAQRAYRPGRSAVRKRAAQVLRRHRTRRLLSSPRSSSARDTSDAVRHR